MKTWITAFRLRTLPLALASIGMGSFLAAAAGKFSWSIFILCVLTTIFLQVLSNLANDYGDAVNGADSIDREGPKRMVHSGAISLRAMKMAILIFVLLSLLTGITLLLVALGFNWKALLFFLTVGILSIIAAIAYTAGRKPYGYMGLGDLSVLIFFGLVGVLGSYYLYTGQFEPSLILPALSCGLFSVAVLNVNNIRDIKSDKKAGKFSIPVRIGRRKAIYYHWFLLLTGILSTTIFVIFFGHQYWQWLFLLAVPFIIYNGMAINKKENSSELDPYLKQMALSTLLFVFLFGIGNLLG